MKWIVILTVYAGMAFAGSASIVTSWLSPCANPAHGIDYEAGYLYHVGGNPANIIYKTTTTGSLVSSLTTTYINGYAIDKISGGYWTVYTKRCYRLNEAGSVITSFGPIADEGYDVTYTGDIKSTLWHTRPGRIYEYYTPTGSVMASFGFAWQGVYYEDGPTPYLWGIAPGSYLICQATTTGIIVNSYAYPLTLTAYGITVGAGYVWITVNNAPAPRVYQISITPGVGVIPASLGRVKAMYH